MSEEGKKDETGGKDKAPVQIEVDGKVYGVKEIQDLKAQQASATQKTQKVASILKAVERYDTDVDTFLAQSENAFGILGDLTSKGVIDEQGRQIAPPAKQKEEINAYDEDFGNEKPAKPNYDTRESDQRMDTVMRALSSLTDEIGAIKKETGKLTKVQLYATVKDKFPDMEQKDITMALNKARADDSKDFLGHAEDIRTDKAAYLKALKDQVLDEVSKEHGLDFNKLSEKKALKEQGPDGAGAMFGKKEFSFSPSKDGETMTPMEATAKYFDSAMEDE